MSAPTTAASAQPASALVRVPPWFQVIFSIVSVQIGASLAKDLFGLIGPTGVVFLRTFLGGLMLLAVLRPRLTGHSPRAYGYVALYAVCIAANMLLFYAAIDRIPLGITVAIAFLGPLSVSVMGSRRLVDLVWVAMAAIGILLLSPITDTTIDALGVAYAFGCAVAWGSIIVVAKRAGTVMPGSGIVALSMCAAAFLTAPFGAVHAVGVLGDLRTIGLALVVAVMSSFIPFLLEFNALRKMSSRAFGLLMSLEPATAAILGWVMLNEALSPEKIVGIALVCVAAAATTLRG